MPTVVSSRSLAASKSFKDYVLSTDFPILSSFPFLKDFQSNSIDNCERELMVHLLLMGAWNADTELRHSANVTHAIMRLVVVIARNSALSDVLVICLMKVINFS